MSKPEFTRPFNVEHAEDGAPIGMKCDQPAKFLAFVEDANPACCVIILEPTRNNIISTRHKSGQTNENHGRQENPYDLVMLPLGMIDGKPVFVGDELTDPTGAAFSPGPRDSGHLAGCRWPAPARAYPETTLSPDHLRAAYNQDMGGPANAALLRTANAALRHAIDTGQVFSKEHVNSVVESTAEAVKAELSGRKARDLAIAKAVLKTCLYMCKPIGGSVQMSRALESIDLYAIIASVPK